MSSFEIVWLPYEGVVFGKFCAGFDFRTDVHASTKQLAYALNQAGKPVPYVFDIIALDMTFSDLIATMAEMTHGDIPMWRHPHLKELIVISKQSLAHIGTDALKQTQYGKLRTSVFHNIGDAMRYLHAKQALFAMMAGSR